MKYSMATLALVGAVYAIPQGAGYGGGYGGGGGGYGGGYGNVPSGVRLPIKHMLIETILTVTDWYLLHVHTLRGEQHSPGPYFDSGFFHACSSPVVQLSFSHQVHQRICLQLYTSVLHG
ncbi:hypothetical protein PTT_16186 [Pyrenophora teres f. teres 0-1]|uniref:Uncharacterized protein n=1 Tax=Pyrenophora teres f. teres (strain 0-1) TaxID=861557 RepID=E3S1R4_PYRTT|nr:hypothetical protein PTT_16186 [Pyrenophora teres f. teres 0-1]